MRRYSFSPSARTLIAVMLAAQALVGCATLTGASRDRDDVATTAAVRWALATDEALPMGATINVNTSHGHVHLTGTVGSQLERLRAAEVARDVAGVFKVTNSLQVTDSGSARQQGQR